MVELDRLLQHYERLLTAAEHPNAPPELTAAAESARAEVNGHVVNNLCRLLLGLTEFARSTDAAALPLAEGSPTAPLVAALEETIEVLNQTRHSFRSRSLGGLRERLEKLLATRR